MAGTAAAAPSTRRARALLQVPPPPRVRHNLPHQWRGSCARAYCGVILGENASAWRRGQSNAAVCLFGWTSSFGLERASSLAAPTMSAPARSYSTWASPGWEKKLARRRLRVIGAAGGRGCSTDGSASAKRLCARRARRRLCRGRRRRRVEEKKLERAAAAAAAAAGWAVEAEVQAHCRPQRSVRLRSAGTQAADARASSASSGCGR